MKIKKNDKIVVISGKDKGKTGVVQGVYKGKDHKGDLVLVEGINIKTHHVKPTQRNPQGGILKKEQPFPLSNVMLNIGIKREIKVTRVKYQIEKNKNGKNDKKRIAKVNNEPI